MAGGGQRPSAFSAFEPGHWKNSKEVDIKVEDGEEGDEVEGAEGFSCQEKLQRHPAASWQSKRSGPEDDEKLLQEVRNNVE